jgi:hypothetical protein
VLKHKRINHKRIISVNVALHKRNLVAYQSWLFRVNLSVVVILIRSLHVEGGPCNRSFTVIIAIILITGDYHGLFLEFQLQG